jgi:uncharacterized protein YbjT (DUF2867 family)
MTRVLVTGGTGNLGRELVAELASNDFTVRIMSRRSRPRHQELHKEWVQADLGTGAGIAEAVSDVQVIAHLASGSFRYPGKVDVQGTRQLLEHASSANVSHFIYISIVGIDRIPFSYYMNKLAAETLVCRASVPWSILRATQFHTFIDAPLQRLARLPVIPLPIDFQFQPLDPKEIADRLYRCLVEGPGGYLPDFGGPEVRSLGDLAQIYMEARGLQRRLVRLPPAGRIAEGFRRGYNTAPHQERGKITWEEWVQSKYGSPYSSQNL